MDLKLDIAKICRVCMSTQEKNSVMISLSNPNVSKKLMSCANVQVWPNDGLPSQICNICAAKLHTSFQFKIQCERSDAHLRHYILKINKNKEQHQQQKDQQQDEHINCNTSSFVFVDCQTSNNAESQFSEESSTIEYYVSSTEPPPLVPITKSNNLIKTEDYAEICDNVDLNFRQKEVENNTNQISAQISQPYEQLHDIEGKNSKENCLDNEICVNPVFKKLKTETCKSTLEDPLQLSKCERQKIVYVQDSSDNFLEYEQQNPNSNEEEILQSSVITEDTANEICHQEKQSTAMQSETLVNSMGSLIRHKCSICNKSFTSSKEYYTHLCNHTDEETFLCFVCDKVCQSAQDLHKHMNIHSGFHKNKRTRVNQKSYTCQMCKEVFTKSTSLNEHMKKHSEENVTSNESEEHHDSHPHKKPFKCTLCDKTFSAIQYLTRHARRHEEEKNFKCALCDRSFVSHFDLKTHTASHSKNKAFQCDLCDKRFPVADDLYMHTKQHNRDLDLKCPICDKPFVSSNDLKDHCVIHAQDKPFGCSKCDKRFSTVNNLNKHEKTHTK